jgi:chemotaxis protein histidine kinase CheA
MAAAQQVANAFAVDFVERVAKNSANLAELYGRRATLTINDFELGISEVSDSDVPLAAQKWATSLQGSRLRVDSVNAAPIYGGVNVFLTLTAFGALQQYFHIATTLESYQDTFGMDGFYIRHQVIARIGAVAPEAPAAPAVPEPTPVVEEKPKKTPASERQPEEKPKKMPAPEPQPEPTPEPAAAAAPAAEPEQAEAEAPQQAAAAAPAPSSAKPKSWAALLSHAPAKTAEHRPVKVVAREAGEKKEAAAPKKEAAAPKEAPAKRPAPRERKAPEPVGDRLMFNITGAVTDDEIRAALGDMASHLVSLRNNSAKGLVFMDFAEHVAAFDEITKAQPVIGAAKLKMSVFRQRSRD